MDVIDRLTAMLTIIDYHTIAFLVNTLLGCYFLRNNHTVTKKLEKKKKNIAIHKAVIKGHNPQHLLQLSSLILRMIKVEARSDTTKFWEDVMGES